MNEPISTEDPNARSLNYATPAAGGSPVSIGVWLMVGGLTLIFLGGCFLIGVMFSYFPGGAANPSFVFLLYALAFICFGSAATLLILGVRKLLRAG